MRRLSNMSVAVAFLFWGLVGLIPLTLGLIFKQGSLGFVGFLFSVVAGFLTGLAGQIVVSVGFATGIIVSWYRKRPRHAEEPANH